MSDTIVIPTHMVVVPEQPKLGEVFDSFPAADRYIKYLARTKKVQGIHRPLE